MQNDNSPGRQPCYALRVRSNFETFVLNHLEARGYSSFLPLYTARRKWSDRLKEGSFPLFPGYLFSRFSFTNRLPILTIPGVVNIVSLGKEPTPVDEEEIRSLLVICGSQLPAQPWPFLRRGQRVVIERGALQGAEGLLVDDRKAYRLVVSITLLQRSVAVEIDRDWVRPILCVDPGRSRAASA